MREILFRGKRIHNKEWVSGFLVVCPWDNTYLIFSGNLQIEERCGCIEWNCIPVIPQTVGQFTGLKDKNGEKIFEGDIVKYFWLSKPNLIEKNEVVKWENVGWNLNSKMTEYEIIGNKFDNPELLGEK